MENANMENLLKRITNKISREFRFKRGKLGLRSTKNRNCFEIFYMSRDRVDDNCYFCLALYFLEEKEQVLVVPSIFCKSGQDEFLSEPGNPFPLSETNKKVKKFLITMCIERFFKDDLVVSYVK